MANSTERSVEILYIIAVSIFVLILMVVQRSLFSIGTIPLIVSDPEVWATKTFTPAAVLVFFVSLLFAGLWYLIALSSNKDYEPKKHYTTMQLKWVGLLLSTVVITVAVTLYFDGDGKSGALPWFVGFLLIDMVLIYWGATAISTPGLLEQVVPGSGLLRKFRIDKN